jgi:hypothetical protein
MASLARTVLHELYRRTDVEVYRVDRSAPAEVGLLSGEVPRKTQTARGPRAVRGRDRDIWDSSIVTLRDIA